MRYREAARSGVELAQSQPESALHWGIIAQAVKRRLCAWMEGVDGMGSEMVGDYRTGAVILR